ncbi:hypothetical protein B0T26DRAFT_746980 [Lasiosphaeria miniovina]|uniref:Uncharacterized protein n=1 Tax=Lasiosphaeria miniovina TaxID=1954250 RepID=A0AA40BJ58_9PEZI|nr:uncharacterized protein B0T26DRAFT_746980 [Lasiosphaeria miniovina]KAK0735163.1 hypothetical protein B0T26DRAFT_746980 [Lasiosphaeria miniovina]
MAVVVQTASAAVAAPKHLSGEIPSRKLTREELLKTHKTYLKRNDVNPDAPRPVKQPELTEAQADTRCEIPLSDLCVETHYRGRGIIVKIISPPYMGAGAPDSSILSVVPEGCIVAVKESYYKHNGAALDYMICVDHPSDVVLLREEEHDEYDFATMLASLNLQSVHLDCGSFLRKTRIAESQHHGRGLFATEAIRAGELVFVEKATLMLNQYEPMRASAALYAMTSFLGDMLISRATRDIIASEELFQQYVPVKSLLDRKSTPAILNRRRDAVAAVEKACNKRQPGRDGVIVMSNTIIRNTNRLAYQLEDLHEPEVYNRLIGAHRGRKNHAKVIKYGLKVLRNFGFLSVLAVADEEIVAADWEPMNIYTRSGDASLITCAEAVEFGYLIVTGFKNDSSVIEAPE